MKVLRLMTIAFLGAFTHINALPLFPINRKWSCRNNTCWPNRTGICFFILVFSSFFCELSAQKYQIESFGLIPNDLSAKINPRHDNNGNPCALIKVQVNSVIESAQGSVVGNIDRIGMETYVYLSEGAKEVKLIFADHLPLHIYFSDNNIEHLGKSETYLLILSEELPLSDNVNNIGRKGSADFVSDIKLQGPDSNHLNLKLGVKTTGKTNLGEYVDIDDLSIVADGNFLGQEYVDLGLTSGLLWATHNIGSALQTDYGDYFAWAEIKSGKKFTNKNCKAYGLPLGDFSGDYHCDAATAGWAHVWRTPTEKDWLELMNECEWLWIKTNERFGYIVYGRNGKAIFLPASGSVNDKGKIQLDNISGFYWTSTPSGEEDATNSRAKNFNMGCANGSIIDINKSDGCTIRPVMDNKHVSH